MNKSFDTRLAKLEVQWLKPEPPLLQLVYTQRDGSLLEMPPQSIPDGNWQGLLRVVVVYDDPGDSGRPDA